MHQNQIWAAIRGTFIVALGAAISVQAAPRQRACAEIRAACEQAGFVQGGARSGEGLFVDCIAPIMRGMPQPRRAGSPLPQINLQSGPATSGGPRAATPQVAPARQRNVPPSQAVDPPVQASPPQPPATPQVAPAPQTNNGGIGEE